MNEYHVAALWKPSSISQLTAGLGMCLLAAATGNMLDDFWRPLWAESGAFGLVAAVGLGIAEKTQAGRAEQLRDSASTARAESSLTRVTQDCTTIDAINAAVNRLTEHAARTRHAQIFPPGRHDRPRRGHMLDGQPLSITSLHEDDADGFDPSTAITTSGSLRQISSRAITFEHDQPITNPTALLTFELADGEQLSLVVDIKWTQKADAIFASGGTILCAGVPTAAEQA